MGRFSGFWRFWGVGQLFFWMVGILGVILMMPLDLYYRTHTPPPWLASLLDLVWFRWEICLVFFLSLVMILVGIAFMSLGWYLLHPIAPDAIGKPADQAPPTPSHHDRIPEIQNFNREAFLTKLQQDAHALFLRRQAKLSLWKRAKS